MTVQHDKYAILRVQFNRLGRILNLSIKLSSGDADFDSRALEKIGQWNHPDLHHPGKYKSNRQSQWYEVRYEE